MRFQTFLQPAALRVAFIAACLFPAWLMAATHNIVMSAETLPNGQPAYKLLSHSSDNGSVPGYAAEATIPGPTLFIKTGDKIKVQLTNNTQSPVSFSAPGLSTGNAAAAAPGQTKSYQLKANKPGTYAYQDDKAAMLGLFGAIVVDEPGGQIQSFVDGDGKIVPIDRSRLNKEFVLFMVGSTFWGSEISSDGNQKPLWTNPDLGAYQDDLLRFHVLAIGPGHTFHLHAHRWIQPGSTQTASPHIIDTHILNSQNNSHVFTVKAGTGVGPGVWQFHCHLISHMQSGMNGRIHVVSRDSGKSADSIAGASPSGAIFGHDSDHPGLATFIVSDEPASWFRSARGDALSPVTHTKSLEIIPPGSSVHFIMSDTAGVHTITSLLWPSEAGHNDHGGDHFMIPFDEAKAYRGGAILKLNVPGLYVFTCKIHPFMFAAVIVDDPATDGLDLGNTIDMVSGIKNLPTSSDLATCLLHTFFVTTVPGNWQNFTSPEPWKTVYPDVDVKVDIGTVNLQDVLHTRYGDNINLKQLGKPAVPGVGEVWVDTQFEKTAGKTKPGTITVVDTSNWKLKRKIALPQINLNNPHNMWPNRDHSVVYTTQWFDNKLTAINQKNGKLISNVQVGDSPSHEMTLPNTDDITVAINGENDVVIIPAGTTNINRALLTQSHGQAPGDPHGHWISADGKRIITPNINTHDAGFYDVEDGKIVARTATGDGQHGAHPIAIGMLPDSSKVYAANLLHHSITVMDENDGHFIKNINLIEHYNPISGDITGPIGILPIQSPVSPDGKVMVTASYGGQLVVIDTRTDTIVKTLPCDPGCHGANFGAKKGGGYYAYVTNKFSNRLIVIDPDPNGDGDLSDAEVAGAVTLVADNSVPKDDTVSNMAGYGGQGVVALPNVYNGWAQNLNSQWSAGLTDQQRNPVQ